MPDFDISEAVDAAGTVEWAGEAYRHTASGRDPLSGEGARLLGGRWNPPGIATVYLATPVETCVAEFARMAEGQGRGVASFPNREMHTFRINGLRVLDLSANNALASVGLDNADLEGPWGPCQAIGEAAHYLRVPCVLAPSATGSGLVLAVFPQHAHGGEIEYLSTEPLANHLATGDT